MLSQVRSSWQAAHRANLPQLGMEFQIFTAPSADPEANSGERQLARQSTGARCPLTTIEAPLSSSAGRPESSSTRTSFESLEPTSSFPATKAMECEALMLDAVLPDVSGRAGAATSHPSRCSRAKSSSPSSVSTATPLASSPKLGRAQRPHTPLATTTEPTHCQLPTSQRRTTPASSAEAMTALAEAARQASRARTGARWPSSTCTTLAEWFSLAAAARSRRAKGKAPAMAEGGRGGCEVV
mmetsp:Transcript_2394/g.5972  ORF Transcript_2394/g.5972 Transcript_2394/m.5972 type:complete len:241 (+) Transcript_2394:262-984(+)